MAIRRGPLPPALAIALLLSPAAGAVPSPRPGAIDPLLGQRSVLERDWVGLRQLPADTPILVLAGHADSQNMGGAGTSGAAVGLGGAAPLYAGITDELFWNMVIAQAVVTLGQRRGLNMRYHQPPWRTIADGDAPGTNWSEGRAHAASGGYALEIHFDAYGPSGIGSGLIPPLHRPFTTVDESLAQEFGGYPMLFRDRLGGPKRGIALLEIGKLEPPLETALRDPGLRVGTVEQIAERVVRALERGLTRPPDGGDSAPPGRRPPANSGGG